MSRPRRSRDEWRTHVAAWKHSRLSGADYALRNNLNPNTFAWWRSELGREWQSERSQSLTLVPVATSHVDVDPIGAHVEVALPEGIVVRVPDRADPLQVARLVRALVAAC